MTKKQKKMLIRILVSGALLIVLHFLPEDFPHLEGVAALPIKSVNPTNRTGDFPLYGS